MLNEARENAEKLLDALHDSADGKKPRTYRKCGMGLVTAKLRETAAHVIALSALLVNLRKIQCALLCLLAGLLVIFWPQKELAVVQ